MRLQKIAAGAQILVPGPVWGFSPASAIGAATYQPEGGLWLPMQLSKQAWNRARAQVVFQAGAMPLSIWIASSESDLLELPDAPQASGVVYGPDPTGGVPSENPLAVAGLDRLGNIAPLQASAAKQLFDGTGNTPGSLATIVDSGILDVSDFPYIVIETEIGVLTSGGTALTVLGVRSDGTQFMLANGGLAAPSGGQAIFQLGGSNPGSSVSGGTNPLWFYSPIRCPPLVQVLFQTGTNTPAGVAGRMTIYGAR